MKPVDILAAYVESVAGFEVVRECRFHPTRKWRFDIALPIAAKIAFEFEGGVFSGGAHTRGAHFVSDVEKYNEAQILGWRVFRLTSKDFTTRGGIPNLKESACDMIRRALK